MTIDLTRRGILAASAAALTSAVALRAATGAAASSGEALLEKVRNENVFYSLSTFEIQKLRAAGVSEPVIEAMLASGRAPQTPTPR